jgi:hypothetical protein
MDRQESYRSFEIECSDTSTIKVEFGFALVCEDEGSIANEQIANFTMSSAFEPIEGIARALLSEDNELEDDTDDEEIDPDMEDGE